MNLCGKKLAQAREEEGKVKEKIRKLQDIFSASFPIIFLISLLAPVISLVVFNKTFDVLISVTAGAALIWAVYVILKRKREKITKDFADRYPEYYAATNEE